MSDFSLKVGISKTLVPSALDPNGQGIIFPVGTVFGWMVSDPSKAVINDPAAASPDILGISATEVLSPLSVNLTIAENGFTHTRSHTVDILAEDVPVDAIGSIDFTLQ
jgi:hypothetical protein